LRLQTPPLPPPLDLRSSLHILGRADASIALLSLNRSLGREGSGWRRGGTGVFTPVSAHGNQAAWHSPPLNGRGRGGDKSPDGTDRIQAGVKPLLVAFKGDENSEGVAEAGMLCHSFGVLVVVGTTSRGCTPACGRVRSSAF